MHFANLLIMRLELLPSLALRSADPTVAAAFPQCGVISGPSSFNYAMAFLSAALLESITSSSSFQELTNDFAPSS